MRKTTICITGGIACGKSLVASFFVNMGVPVIDADVVCHDLLQPGRPAHAAVVQAFGRSVLARNNQIDRAALGSMVFSNPSALSVLNAIMHQDARRLISKWVASGGRTAVPGAILPKDQSFISSKNGSALVAATVPLLYESGWESDWDFVVCVVSPTILQRRRLAARGLNPAGIRNRLAAQLPTSAKARCADAVIFNVGAPSHAQEQTRRIINCVLNT